MDSSEVIGAGWGLFINQVFDVVKSYALPVTVDVVLEAMGGKTETDRHFVEWALEMLRENGDTHYAKEVQR